MTTDLKPGAEFGPSSWIDVPQDKIDAFAEATGDHQWIHVDPARAAAGPFGSTIGHGYLTLALLPVMSYEVVPRQGDGMAVNYGLNKVRFPAPVHVGARVRCRGQLLQAEEIGAAVQTVVRMTVEVEDQERPGCVADTLSRYYRDAQG